jgi:hypothetical protein
VIFDRTQNDVDTAILLRKEKVQKFKELTEEEIEILEKGTMTINTLNRIESKQEELKNLFNEIGYWNVEIENKSWGFGDIFGVEDFARIVDNTVSLRNAFFVYKNTPNTPPVSFHYKDVNALEKILNDLDVMINDVKSNYKVCGDYESGE